MIIKLLDIISSILTVTSLFLVTKSYKWWLVYSVASVCFTAVMIHSKLWGLTVMGVLLFIVGINNYLKGRK